MGQVRGICEGKFKANFGIRIIMFDYITKSINWGSKGQRKNWKCCKVYEMGIRIRIAYAKNFISVNPAKNF